MSTARVEQTELLRAEAARRPNGGARSVANLTDVLFEQVRNPQTGEFWTEPEVADATVDDLNGCQQLSTEKIRSIRRREGEGVSFGDLVMLCGVFDVDPGYFEPEVDPGCLPSDVHEARRTFSDRERLGSAGRIAEDLSRIISGTSHPEGGSWTPERVEEATDGRIKAGFLRALLEERVAAPDAQRIVLIAEVVGFDAMLFWERNLGPLALNSLRL